MDASRALGGAGTTVGALSGPLERTIPAPDGPDASTGTLPFQHEANDRPSRQHLGASPQDRLRRAIDIFTAATALLLLSPVIGLIALAIRIDSPGSPFFVQWRTGYRGCRFRMFKFRTMVRDADRLRPTLTERSHLSSPDFKVAGDPRITRVGRFLRRWSLDELPQLANVLLGDMALVGPRPTSFPAEAYEPWQRRRLDVKPGLSGLWQVSGRSNIDFADRVRLDIHYVDHRSLWLDLQILVRTPSAVLRGDGAH